MNSPQQPASPSAPLAAAPSDDKDARVMAALAHGLTFFEGGLIGPLILYFVKKDEDEFVAFHALQSLYFGLAFFALTILTCGLLGILLVLPYVIFEGIATLKAYEGERYELPVVGRYAREKHPGPAGAAPTPAAY